MTFFELHAGYIAKENKIFQARLSFISHETFFICPGKRRVSPIRFNIVDKFIKA